MMAEPERKLLVTTALEETWGTNEPIVFLGEWCRLYDRRDVWQKRNHQVVRYHWDDRKKLQNDYDYLKKLYDSLLVSLTATMNRLHQIERPVRYWQMILAPWLLTYVAIIWDRWESLRLAFEDHDYLETIAFVPAAEHKPCFGYRDLINKVQDDSINDVWNGQLFFEIIESNYSSRCKTIKYPTQLAAFKRLDAYSPDRPKARTSVYKIAKFIDGLLSPLAKQNSIVFFQTYFPPLPLLKLHLTLGQIPHLYLDEFEWPVALESADGYAGNRVIRDGIQIDLEPGNPFEAFMFKRMVKDLPWVNVEGFAALRTKASKIRMTPEVILSANAFWENEPFKVWSAEQVFRGAKLITMEHGGALPSLQDSMGFVEDIAEIKTKWCIPHHPKHVRLPANKLVGRPRTIKSSGRFLAVVGIETPRYSYQAQSWPFSGQVLLHFEMVCGLYAELVPEIRARFRVKPFFNRGWNTSQRFIDRLGANKVANDQDFYHFLASARLVVCTYPQTPFSESMASGLPTVLFYPRHLWETIPELDPVLEILRSAKIVFDDPKSLAAHINNIWQKPEVWWDSHEVVRAREEFYLQVLDLDGDWLTQWSSFVRGTLASRPEEDMRSTR